VFLLITLLLQVAAVAAVTFLGAVEVVVIALLLVHLAVVLLPNQAFLWLKELLTQLLLVLAALVVLLVQPETHQGPKVQMEVIQYCLSLLRLAAVVVVPTVMLQVVSKMEKQVVPAAAQAHQKEAAEVQLVLAL
jgi:hypothetical protein